MTEFENLNFDAGEAGHRIGRMWIALAEKIEQGIESIVVDSNDPVKAIRWATCAEACFWKATGEADAHDIEDVLHD